MKRALAALHRLAGQFLYEALIRTLRSSFLIGGAVVLVSSTGTWKYFVSSFAARDFVQAGQWSSNSGTSGVATVAIDDRAYRDYFGDRSPLDRARLLALLQTIATAAPQARAIVVDLDLTPLPGHAQHALLRFLAGDPRRWVLAVPLQGDSPASPERAAWQRALCRAGVRLGLPYLPTDFGEVSPLAQFDGALSQVAADPSYDCARLRATLKAAAHDGSAHLRRIAAPMSPGAVRDGLVIPFDGDLQQLGMLLQAASPRWIVLGGTWGKSDLLATALGKRYGAQLHAAALAGRLRGERVAPLLVQILVAWLFLACLDLVLGVLYRGIERLLLPWTANHAGHRFLATRIWPVTLVVMAIAAVLLASDGCALLRARTGYWVPSAMIAGVTLVNTLFVWNWGLNKLVRHASVATAWREVFVAPIVTDWSAMLHAAALLRAHARGAAPADGLGAPRAALECVAAVASLLLQTGFPLLVLAHALA